MDFLNYLRNASFEKKYLIIVLSVIGGITGGALLILYPNAALHVFDQGRYVFFLAVLPPTSCVYLLAKRFSQSQAANITEHLLEDQILSIANTIRHDELTDFEKRNRADIFMTLVNARSITQGATKSIDSFTHNITILIGWLYIYLYLAPMLGILILIWRLIYILFREAFQKIIKSIAMEEIGTQKKLFNLFESHLFGFKELKFNRNKMDDLFDNHLAPVAEQIKQLRIKARFYASELMLFYVVSILLLMGTCVFILSASITTETALKAIIMMLFMMKTDIIILSSLPFIMEGNAALDRMRNLFPAASLKDKDKGLYVPGRELFQEVRSISMEGIRYAYSGSDSEPGFTVEIDHLNVKSGEILFIVGGNGSGKSTLVNILTGLYPPGAGRIRINDHAVTMAHHRYLFSTVLADFHLFDRIYGMEAVDDRRVNDMLKTMGLVGKTRYYEGRFSSLDLSSGQKKRLALIIALMEDKPVYVFDEWAADQDPGFRRIFYEEILPSFRRRGKIVIAITHDDHYFSAADQVIRMQDGRIVDRLRTETEKKTARLFMDKEQASESATHTVIDDPSGKTPEMKMPPRSMVTESVEPAFKRGILAQFSRMYSERKDSLKKVLLLLTLVSFALVAAPIVILSSAHLPPGQSRHIPFVQFIVLLVLYVMSFRRLNRTFHETVEDRITGFRLRIVDRVRKTSLMILETIGPGRILTKLTSDIKAIADTSITMLMTILGGVRTLMIYLYIAFLYFPTFLIMTALACLGGGLYTLNHNRLIRLFEQLRDRERLLFDSVNHLLEGFKELKLNSKKSDDFYGQHFRKHCAELRELKLRTSGHYINNYTIAYAFFEMTLLSLTLIMPCFGADPRVLPIAVALLLTMPLNQVIDHYSQFHMAFMSLQQLLRFEEYMRNVCQEEDAPEPAREKIRFEEIRMDRIAFTYRLGDGPAFHIGPLSLCIQRGEIVFLTGGNGSGKSTLLKVITGLYGPDTGRILVNGAEQDVRRHQECFAGVFSDYYLFDRLYGMKDFEDARVEDLLGRFHLKGKIACSGGIFSPLNLSTGQRKRLALVVAILEDKPVYVFDEWAADQDPFFREYFYQTLLPEFKKDGKTIIAATHDDRFFHCADRVIHMEYGQIVNPLQER